MPVSNEVIAYFDNAATSFPKPECVYRLADEFYRKCGVNVGRGQHPLASKAAALLEDTRDKLLDLYSCRNKQVVISASATEAINKIVFGLDLPPFSTVYISPFEHNSVTRVIHALQRDKQIEIKTLRFDQHTLLFDLNETKKDFQNHKPELVVATHASNVCGAVLPVDTVFSLAKEFQATTVVDMSQTSGLLELDLASNDIDYAVFAGHKSLLAPLGIGGFICGKKAQLKPLLFGGTGSQSIDQEPPELLKECMEIGSPNIYAIAGLNAALDWIIDKGFKSIQDDEKDRTKRLLDILRSHDNITIIADRMKCERIGVVSALFDNYSPDEIGFSLNERGIATRTGLHCSPYAHSFLKTSPNGSVRFSVSCLTDYNYFAILEDALQAIEEAG